MTKWHYVQQPDWSDAQEIVDSLTDYTLLDITQEFLDQAPHSLMLRDGPFLMFRSKTRDVCYEIINHDVPSQVTTARRIKIIEHI